MHTVGQVISFVEKAFGQTKLTHASREANVVCPLCEENNGSGKRKLAIRTDVLFAKCWVCGFKSRNLIFLLKKFKPDLLQEYLETFQDTLSINTVDYDESGFFPSLSLPNGFLLLAEFIGKQNQGPEVRKALNYLLYQRHVTKRDLWYYKFGITLQDYDYLNRIIIPSHDVDGKLNFFTSRTYTKTNRGIQRYQNPICEREKIVFNEINVDWSQELILVEGPFDLTKVIDNAVPLLGKELTENYALFHRIIENNTPVVLSLDNDAFDHSIKLCELFLKYDIPVRICFPPKNMKDFGEARTKDVFASSLEKALRVNDSGDILRLKIERICA